MVGEAGGGCTVGLPFLGGARCGWHFCVWEEEDGELERELRMRALG